MSAHTPGPWSYEYEPRANMSMIAGRDFVVCGIPNEREAVDREAQHANAALIAAAPDLADALERLVRADWQSESGALIAARDALRKAGR